MNIEQKISFYALGSTDNLDISYESLTAELDDISQEGLKDLYKYLKKASMLVPRMIDRVLARNIPATNVTPVNMSLYTSLLKKYNISHDRLANVMAHRPADLDVTMDTHLKVILEQMPRYSDIAIRLYEPLIDLFSDAAADQNALTRVWKTGEIKLNNPSKDVKEFKKHFLVSKYDERPAEQAAFTDVYPSKKKCDDVYSMLSISLDSARSIDLKELKKREAVLITYVNAFLDELDPTNVKVNKEIQKNVLSAMRAIVDETEYMVGLVNLVTIAGASWNHTMENLDTSIKHMLEDKED